MPKGGIPRPGPDTAVPGWWGWMGRDLPEGRPEACLWGTGSTRWPTPGPVRTGLGIARVLRRRYDERWEYEKVSRLLANDAAMRAWQEAGALDTVVGVWAKELKSFENVRRQYVMYE